ncbi:hypothetical protein GCM10007172_25120 [Sinomonas atrocyanea]|nr:hypothetical protein GCM10007172_25120 [Sinomonas atrocyanea]
MKLARASPKALAAVQAAVDDGLAVVVAVGLEVPTDGLGVVVADGLEVPTDGLGGLVPVGPGVLLHPASSISAAPSAANRAPSRWFRDIGGPFRSGWPGSAEEGINQIRRLPRRPGVSAAVRAVSLAMVRARTRR